jgi:Rrf2 family protein
MKLSTKSRYGTRAMIDIAIHSNSGSCMLKDIAQRQDVSAKYLDHILSSLRKAGLIKNIRGKYGGYSLTRPASEITMKDILGSVEASLAPVECVDNTSACHKTGTCSSRDVWVRIKEAIEDVLESTTLASLVESSNKKEATGVNYII